MAGQRIRDFKKIKSEDSTLNRMQDQVEFTISQLVRTEILDGRLMKEVKLQTGSTNVIEHKLGRAIRGWVLTRKRANATVWDSQDSNTRQDKFLNLECSADVSVDLWVF